MGNISPYSQIVSHARPIFATRLVSGRGGAQPLPTFDKNCDKRLAGFDDDDDDLAPPPHSRPASWSGYKAFCWLTRLSGTILAWASSFRVGRRTSAIIGLGGYCAHCVTSIDWGSRTLVLVEVLWLPMFTTKPEYAIRMARVQFRGVEWDSRH